MCYWYAGSTYEVLQHLVYIPRLGYVLMREKQDTGDMQGLVDLVKGFEWTRASLERKRYFEEVLNQGVEEELRKVPTFEDLCNRARERKEEVLRVIGQREGEHKTRQVAEQQRVAAEQQLAELRAQLAARSG
ncbi:hypothetical protein N0V88_007901 [Collariella sp. IMI 366227]|nr:hypothetical protein N0V88_007901 [Collariella sp. IMI 366227]